MEGLHVSPTHLSLILVSVVDESLLVQLMDKEPENGDSNEGLPCASVDSIVHLVVDMMDLLHSLKDIG